METAFPGITIPREPTCLRKSEEFRFETTNTVLTQTAEYPMKRPLLEYADDE